MIRRKQVVAFGTGVVVATVFAVATSTLRAQAQTAPAIVACVGTDRVFRLAGLDRGCAPGEQRHVLSPAKPEMEEPKVVNSDHPSTPRVPSEARVRTLEDRVAQLERELVRSRDVEHKLPFVLFDQSGKLALTVTQTPAGPSLELLSNGKAAVQIGFGPSGNARVAVMKPDGTLAAALGMNTAGNGALAVHDAAGLPVAGMVGAGPIGPTIGVGKGDGAYLAAILLGKNGGKLELADNTGGITADAGTLDSGAGVFRVRGEIFQYIAGQRGRLPGW
jgi:hypothetical protein